MNMKFFAALTIILIFSGCYGEKNKINDINKLTPAETKKTSGFGIINVDRLRLRADNDLHSKTLRYLDKGDIVRIIDKDNDRVRIDDMEDYWYEIEYNGITGWIFGYYVDLYSDYESARIGSGRYASSQSGIEKKPVYEEPIADNLFFISNARLFRIPAGLSSEPVQLKSEDGYRIMNYFFTKRSRKLFYIASRSGNIDGNCNLYSYDFASKTNALLLKSIYTAYFDPDKNSIITAGIGKKMLDEYWIIGIFDLLKKEPVKEVIRFKKGHDEEIQKGDFFSRTLGRELGTLCYLEWNDKKNLIYFKPPEENQTYLVSTGDGSFIRIDVEKSNMFVIDSSKYLEMGSSLDKNGNTVYVITLKDKFSGIEKEISSSPLYPLNFSLSPKLNYVAITMADNGKTVNGCYSTSIYLLSLNNYSLSRLTFDNASYQPKWSYYPLK
jgi:hypothetical protein